MMTAVLDVASMVALALFMLMLFAAIWNRSNDIGSIAMWLAVASGALGAASAATYLFGA